MDVDVPVVSVIVGTAGGSERIAVLLSSIASISQKGRVSIELIVVDQSFDTRTWHVLESWKAEVKLIYLHALERGLSRSRNIGLSVATGDIVCFGDDDCSYGEEAFDRAMHHILQGWDIVTGGVYIPGTDDLTAYTRKTTPGQLTPQGLAGRLTSISLFIRGSLFDKGVRFDELLGLGAKFESCEEIDLVIRLLGQGHQGFFDPAVRVYHVQPEQYSPEKSYRYATGHGALAMKLIRSSRLSNVILGGAKIARCFARMLLAPVFRRKQGLNYAKGFYKGFSNYGSYRGD